ncbi:protein shuttle craft-like [Ornithodoros turicata]|uniref:protein shuttle craft-like n=1 Tax=Ornithodoros turicata TaxID=34597 RepID=UPI003139E30B
MEDVPMCSGAYIPQSELYHTFDDGRRTSYVASDVQLPSAASAPVEHRGFYYFDPQLNQPVSSAVWSTGDCRTPQSIGIPTVSLNRNSSNFKHYANQCANVGSNVRASKQKGSEERSRRKGEPFRYDRRFYNRTHNEWAQPCSVPYSEASHSNNSSPKCTGDGISPGTPSARKARKSARERRNPTNQPPPNGVHVVEEVYNHCSQQNVNVRSSRKQSQQRYERNQGPQRAEKDKEQHPPAGPGGASTSGSAETSQGATARKNRSPRVNPGPPAAARQDQRAKWRTKENHEDSARWKDEVARHAGEEGQRSAEPRRTAKQDEMKWKKGCNFPMVWLRESAIDRSIFPKKVQSSSVSRADDAPQKDRLTEQLMNGDCECMICCERMRGSDPVWSCCNCYHIYHLHCVRKWATSPSAIVKEGGWRCPACQHTTKAVPHQYFCFCGKRVDPEWNRYGVPHSCGEMCGRNRGCVHRCTLQCHPGPCPPCSATVRRPCHCGRITRCVRCSQQQDLSCGDPCGQLLNCEIHTCDVPCHAGGCKPCEKIVTQRCYCSKKSKEVTCTKEMNVSSEYSCGESCGRPLECGSHDCSKPCHFGECGDCPRLPHLVLSCPCGQTLLEDIAGTKPRTTCTDPVPLCGSTCGKELQCGPIDNPHRCQAKCHEGDCPDCPLSTLIRCRCGATSRDVLCMEAASLEEQTCQRRCQKRRQCGRHKCLVMCCVDTEHPCPLTCGKRLTCGLHVCQEPCHRGNCHTCWNVSFEDLACHCGSTSISPPVPCGTRPPECSQPCLRPHPCGHTVTHTCHSEDFCPPCAALTEKWCYGRHEKRKAVPCFLEGLSCGMPCNKELGCGLHRCKSTCHAGPCLTSDACEQPCPRPRPSCGHPCAEACHTGNCPSTPCKAAVTITCACGHRSERVSCGEGGPAYNQLSASVLATKLQGIQLGESVDIGEVMALSKTKPSRLECNEECALVERNRRLAAALHIQNADLSSQVGTSCYSEFLKEEARKNPASVAAVYQKLTELVQTAKQSKQKFRSHSFPSMNRDQRRVVHELAESFGCETQSYDAEPHRNVVVTAHREKCHVPSVNLMSLVRRETGQRKGPAPVSVAWRRDQQPASAFFGLSANSSAASSSNSAQRDEPKSSCLDYFNYAS